jgi:hypothetical protein
LTSDAADPGHQFLLVPDSMRHDSESYPTPVWCQSRHFNFPAERKPP